MTLPAELVASCVMSAWIAITGAVVSTTFTTKVVGVAALPCASAAVQVTVVLPRGKFEPEAGKQEAVLAPSTISEVDGLV